LFCVHAAPLTVHVPESVGQLASWKHSRPVRLQWPESTQLLLDVHALPSALHAPGIVGH